MANVIFFINYFRRHKQGQNFTDAFQHLNNWLGIITPRGWISLITSLLLILAVTNFKTEILPLTLLATIAIFLLALMLIFTSIACIAKLFIALKNNFLNQTVYHSAISKSEINENEAVSISIKIKTGIPWGYLLKISEKMPDKLGGELRAVSLNTEKGISSFQATIPYTRRGIYEIGPTKFQYQDIFGFTNIKLLHPQRFTLNILPEVPQIKYFTFKLSALPGIENQTIASRFNDDDFYATRPYVRGDDTRKMHWKLSAKKDTFIIRQPETTNISFKKLEILILNTIPLIPETKKDANIKNRIDFRFKTMIEYSLDSQIHIAAALIDYALREKIPVSFSWFDQEGNLVTFQPENDDPAKWKYTLATIKIIAKSLAIDTLTNYFAPNNSYLITSSETSLDRLNLIKDIAEKQQAQLEILYTPTSNQIQDFLKKKPTSKSKNRILQWINRFLFTKTYFEQEPIWEKVYNYFAHYQVSFSEADLKYFLSLESTLLSELQRLDLTYRDFSNHDPFLSEIDNIVKVLENV
ncbi:MAG: DUF58 domain-containing protein [bacterium]